MVLSVPNIETSKIFYDDEKLYYCIQLIQIYMRQLLSSTTDNKWNSLPRCNSYTCTSVFMQLLLLLYKCCLVWVTREILAHTMDSLVWTWQTTGEWVSKKRQITSLWHWWYFYSPALLSRQWLPLAWTMGTLTNIQNKWVLPPHAHC